MADKIGAAVSVVIACVIVIVILFYLSQAFAATPYGATSAYLCYLGMGVLGTIAIAAIHSAVI